MFLPEQHELLLQIIERPDDDELRLVLADRLNEASDPLGELIIVQVTLERLLTGRGSGDYLALRRRESELVARHGATWHEQTAPFARRITFKRGLPDTLRCSANDLLVDGGLTVLGPVRQLELEHVDAVQLEDLFALPLLRRISALGLPDLRGLGRLTRRPRRMPDNISRLRLGIDGFRALDAAGTLGLLDPVQELELGTRFLLPQAMEALEAPAAPRLVKLQLVGLPPAERMLDSAWREALRTLTDTRPNLTVVFRGIEHDASNLHRLSLPVEPDRLDEAPAVDASHFNREPLGKLDEGERVDRKIPLRLELSRLADGALVARTWFDASLAERLQPLSLDAITHLSLEPHPAVLAARAYGIDRTGLALRYEAWPSRSLAELELPLPAPVALAVMRGVAAGLLPLRAGLLRQGLLGFPSALSLDDVLVGHDGAVKLLPPFRNTMMGDERRREFVEWLRPLGPLPDPQLEGTDDAVLYLLGSGLMHLLTGEAVRSLRLLPSALDASLAPFDPLVRGCLSPKRSERFAGVEAFVEAVNGAHLAASQDEVARAGRERQSS